MQPLYVYFFIDKILYLAVPAGILNSTTCPFFAPSSAAPIGDSLEILFCVRSTSVEPTIVYSASSLNSKSFTFTVFPI